MAKMKTFAEKLLSSANRCTYRPPEVACYYGDFTKATRVAHAQFYTVLGFVQFFYPTYKLGWVDDLELGDEVVAIDTRGNKILTVVCRDPTGMDPGARTVTPFWDTLQVKKG